MSRFKSVKTEFTALPNKVIQGFYLSAEATLVLITCLSYPNDWVYRPTHLWKNLPLSRNKVYKAIGELIEKGHCIKMEKKTKNLKSGVDYIFFDDPDVCKKILEDKKTEFEDPDFYVTHAWNSKKDLRDSSFRETEAWNSKDGELTKTHKSNKKEEQQQPAAPVVVFPCLKKIKDPSVTNKHKEQITKKYPEQVVIDAVDASLEVTPDSTMLKLLHAALKEKWKPTGNKKENIEENEKYATKIFHKLDFNDARRKGWMYTKGSTYVEISYSAQKIPFVLKYDTKDFKKKLDEELVKNDAKC